MQDISLARLHAEVSTFSSSKRFSTWAGTYSCAPLSIIEPTNVNQCRLAVELARREGRSLRVSGVGHSPSDVACTDEYMLSTLKLNSLISVDREKRLVVAQTGMLLHTLNDILHAHGLAMPILGSISDQTLGGVITTATHGSGVHFGVLSTLVLSLTLLLADGSLVTCSRDHEPDLFLATLCGLGSTGLVIDACLQVEPAFRLREDREAQNFASTVRCLDMIAHSAEHVKFWWFPQSDAMCVYRSNRTSAAPSPTSWRAALWDLVVGFHFVEFLLFLGQFWADMNTTVSRFVFKLNSASTTQIAQSSQIFNLENLFSQYTTEWAIPYENTQDCLFALNEWLQRELRAPDGLRPHFPIEIRFTAPDDITVSPSFGRKTTWIGIIQYRAYGRTVPYKELFAEFSAIMRRHGGRPHWAKQHDAGPAELAALYPKFDDFRTVLAKFDPSGLWRNPYIERCIFGRPSAVDHASD